MTFAVNGMATACLVKKLPTELTASEKLAPFLSVMTTDSPPVVPLVPLQSMSSLYLGKTVPAIV